MVNGSEITPLYSKGRLIGFVSLQNYEGDSDLGNEANTDMIIDSFVIAMVVHINQIPRDGKTTTS